MNGSALPSSDPVSVSYDAETQTLKVKLQNGGVHEYRRVPETVFGRMMVADSWNEFFTSEIVGRYRFREQWRYAQF